MTRGRDLLHDRFVAALEGTWRNAPLGRWMTEHRKEFASTLRPHREPPWDKLAQAFAAGLRDGRGKLPDADATRHSWAAVRAQQQARPRSNSQGD